MIKKRELKGVLPVFQMPYDDRENIDFSVLEKEIDWLYENECDGIVFALASEIIRLTETERKKVAEKICKFNKDRGCVIVSVGGESTFQAIDFARHAQDSGADAVMAIPPISNPCPEDQVKQYYEDILSSIQIPLVVQDASGYLGNSMSIELQSYLFNNFPEKILFKPESNPIGPRLSELRDATSGKAPIFEGSGGISLVDSFKRGIKGTMPGSDLIDIIVALWKALLKGDNSRIYNISFPLSSFISILTSLDAFLTIEKYILVKRGIFKNSVIRKPCNYKLDHETIKEVDLIFSKLMRALDSDDK